MLNIYSCGYECDGKFGLLMISLKYYCGRMIIQHRSLMILKNKNGVYNFEFVYDFFSNPHMVKSIHIPTNIWLNGT